MAVTKHNPIRAEINDVSMKIESVNKAILPWALPDRLALPAAIDTKRRDIDKAHSTGAKTHRRTHGETQYRLI